MYATLPVYYPSFAYATQHDERELWLESHRVNLECRGQINRRAMEVHDSRELDLMIEDLIRIYGVERTLCVLSRTVQFRDWDARISHAVKERAKQFDFQEWALDDENDPSEEYVCPDISVHAVDYICRRLMEREAEQLAQEQRRHEIEHGGPDQ